MPINAADVVNVAMTTRTTPHPHHHHYLSIFSSLYRQLSARNLPTSAITVAAATAD